MLIGDEGALIATGTLDRFGDLIRRAAVPVAVYSATGSASAVGTVFAVSFIPHLIMLGVSSRLGAPNKARGSLIWFNLARFAVSLVMMALAIRGDYGYRFLTTIFILAALTAVIEAAFGTATRLVSQQSAVADTQKLNARLSTWQNGVAATVGSPLGGWLGAILPPVAFAIDAVTYLLAALTIRWSDIAKEAASRANTASHGVAEAVRWLRQNPFNLAIVFTTVALQLASGLTLGNLIVVAVDQYGLPDWIFGVLTLIFTSTGFVGSLFISRRSPDPVALLGVAALPSVIGYLAISLGSSPAVLIVGLVALALSIAGWNIASAGRMQSDPPDDVVGGVLAFWRSAGVAAIAAGSAIGGFLIDATDTVNAIVLSTVVCAVAAGIMALGARRERTTLSFADVS